VRFLPYRDSRVIPGSFIDRLKIVGSNLDEFSCPFCFSTDRERNMYRFFRAANIFEKFVSGKRILYIAPETNFRNLIKNWAPLEVVEGDLFPKADQVRVDLADIQFPSNYFDFVICNHVLEHVENVDTCLLEIKRVLGNNGALLAQTPFSKILTTTLEIKEAWGDAGFCEAAHGQYDHLRVFGGDFVEIIEERGFLLHETGGGLNSKERFDCNLGINEDEPFLFFISK